MDNKKKGKKRNKKYKIGYILIGLFITIGLLISIEQYISWGSFFEFKDVHHEMFIVMFIFGGLSILLYMYILKIKKGKK